MSKTCAGQLGDLIPQLIVYFCGTYSKTMYFSLQFVLVTVGDLIFVVRVFIQVWDGVFCHAECMCVMVKGTGVILHGTGVILQVTGVMLKGTGVILHGTGLMLHGTGVMLESTGVMLCGVDTLVFRPCFWNPFFAPHKPYNKHFVLS